MIEDIGIEGLNVAHVPFIDELTAFNNGHRVMLLDQGHDINIDALDATAHAYIVDVTTRDDFADNFKHPI